MKKTIILAMAFLALNVNAQTKISSYNMSYINETKDILLSKSKNGKYTIYLEGFSMDGVSKKGGVFFDKKEHQDLILKLTQAKQKYIEWVEVAKKNDVKDMVKDMDFKSYCNGGYFYYGNSLNLELNFNALYKFKVRQDSNGNVNYLLMINSGELQSSDNRFIKSDGVSIIFSSVEEIDYLLNEISIDKISKLVNEPDKGDLFK